MNKQIYAILEEAYQLSNQIKANSKRLTELKSKLLKFVKPPTDKRSTAICMGDLKAKISFRTVTKWDQDVLEKLKDRLGDNIFFNHFFSEYKPIYSKISDRAIFSDDVSQELFNNAKKTEPASPYIELSRTAE